MLERAARWAVQDRNVHFEVAGSIERRHDGARAGVHEPCWWHHISYLQVLTASTTAPALVVSSAFFSASKRLVQWVLPGAGCPPTRMTVSGAISRIARAIPSSPNPSQTAPSLLRLPDNKRQFLSVRCRPGHSGLPRSWSRRLSRCSSYRQQVTLPENPDRHASRDSRGTLRVLPGRTRAGRQRCRQGQRRSAVAVEQEQGVFEPVVPAADPNCAGPAGNTGNFIEVYLHFLHPGLQYREQEGPGGFPGPMQVLPQAHFSFVCTPVVLAGRDNCKIARPGNTERFLGTSQPPASRARAAAERTEPGVILIFSRNCFPGKRYVPAEVCRIPGPGRTCARAWAVVVFPWAPVISIIGWGSESPKSLRTASWWVITGAFCKRSRG